MKIGDLCEAKEMKNTFAVSLENEPREGARGGDVDHIYSFRPGLFHHIAEGEEKREPILHHIAAGWRYLTMYVAALRRAGALLSIAMHTFERLAIRHWTSLLTCLPHPRVVRAHENDQAPLTLTKRQICRYCFLLLLPLLLVVLWLLVPLLLHRPSWLQRERGIEAVEGALHPSRRVLAENAYPDRRDNSSFVLSVHPLPQTSSDQGLSLRSRRTQPQEMATLIIRKEDARPLVRREE